MTKAQRTLFPCTDITDHIEEGLGEHVVIKLMTPHFNIGLNVTTDNLFTNFVTAKKLHQHNITTVCTAHQNRKEIVEELSQNIRD